MKNVDNKNLKEAINHTLDLITGVDNVLIGLREDGEKEDGLMIKQYKHLRKHHAKTLIEQLQKMNLNFNLIET